MDDNSKLLEQAKCHLTTTEFGIMKLLAQSPDSIFNGANMNRMPYNGGSTVAVHIRHIKRENRDKPQGSRYIR